MIRLESPDLSSVEDVAFSPDGSRLVVTPPDLPSPCVHVWDLRSIRKHLAEGDLDWEAPAYPEAETIAADGPTPPWTVAVDLGAYWGLGAETWALIRRAEGLERAGRVGEAIDVLRRVLGQSPDLAETRNALAWLLATSPRPVRHPIEAIEHARRAVELVPDEAMYRNTDGVALYRAGRFAEAVRILEKSLAAGRGFFDGFDLFFLAMAHHRLGHREVAGAAFDRAVRWVHDRTILSSQEAQELAGFRAEAEAILAELPDDVFAPAGP